MRDRSESVAWLRERPGLTGLALVSVVLALQVLRPYLQFVLFGGILAYVLVPLQRRLERHVRESVAAFVLVVAAVFVIVLPIAYILFVAIRQSADLVAAVQNGDLDFGWIERALGVPVETAELVDLYESYQGQISSAAQQLAGAVLDVAGGLPGAMIGVTVALFVCFALLREHDRFLAWTYDVLPVEDRLQEELYEELDLLMRAAVISNVAVAAIQAVMLGVALAVLGFPAIVLLTVLTFLLTLLPLVGAFGVWLPASIYLLAVGRPVAAAGLFVYGVFVTFSDTYLRPALLGKTSAFNTATMVVGIFGGLVAFGAVGLFIGPVVLGGAKVTLDIFGRERTRREEGETGPTTDPDSPGSDVAPDAEAPTNAGPSPGAETDADTEERRDP